MANKNNVTVNASTKEILKMLKKSGLVVQVKESKVEDVKSEFDNKAYHNTDLLLKQYRTIKWMIECFPSQIEEELSASFEDFDDLMLKLGIEERAYSNYHISGRAKSLSKSRMILDLVNQSLTVLKKKPKNGDLLYRIIYLSYIADEELDAKNIAYSLDLSERHFFRLKNEAIRAISLYLWAAPTREMERWLDAIVEMGDKLKGC